MLSPCPACHRHVSIDARSCVFCGAPLPAQKPREPVAFVGRASRAMVFAGAIAAAPLGCGSQVQYEPAATANAQVGQVRGRVVRDDGQPAGGNSVSLYGEQLRSSHDGIDSISVLADPTGNFHFDNVPPGEYRIATSGLGKEPHVVVRAGQAAVLTLELEPPPKFDPNQAAKPYGAPPARGRIV